VATFSGLSLNKAAGGYTVVASGGSLTAATTSSVTVVAAAATQWVISTQPPASVTAGNPFGLVVTAQDSFGNTATGFSGSVTVSILANPGGATLGGTLTRTATAGVVSFNDLTLNKTAAGYTMLATASGLPPAPSNPITVDPGAAAQLVVSTQPPENIVAGSSFSLTVAVEDSFGNLVTTASNNVTLSLATNPGGATLGGTITAIPSNGLVAFNGLMVNKPGAGYTLTAASPGLTTGATAAFNVSPAGQPQWVVTTQPPASATAGSAVSMTVTAEDGLGNVETTYNGSVTLALGANPGGATLSGTLTATASAGVATFTGLGLDKAAGGYTLVASGGGLNAATTSTITIVPAAAAQWTIASQPPASVTAGAPIGMVVTARDSFGNTTTSFNGSVTVSIIANPGGASLGGTVTRTATAGMASFTDLTLNRAGAGYTLSASGSGLASATTTTLSVNAAAATQWVVTTQPPSSVSAGTGFGMVLKAQDSFGNVDPTFNKTVTVALGANPGGASLAGTLTLNAAAGIATFSGLSLNKAVSGYTLVVSGGSLNTATTSSVTVVAAAAANWVISAQPPASVTAGDPFEMALTAEDSFGNTDISFNGSVTVSILSNPGGAILGGTVTRTASAGVATFDDLTLDRAGLGYTLSASGSGLLSATTTTLSVNAAAATQWAVTSQPPSSVTAGAGFGLVLKAEDSQGNVDPSYSGTVTVSLGANPGAATLGGTLSINASAGVFTFSGLGLDEAASGYTLVASGGGLTTATTSSVTVVAAAATQWVISSQPPASVRAGNPFGLVVTAQDNFGNTATSYSSSVTVSILADPGAATLGGTVTRTAAAGVATFDDLTLDHVGAGFTLSATGGGLSPGTTTTLNVAAAAATQWVVTTQPPSSVTAGAGFGLVLKAEDSQGNVDPTYNGAVTVSLGANPGAATLGGTLTINASAGVATLAGLSLDKAASGYTLMASGGSLSTATTSSITAVAAAATQWVVSTQPPTSVTAGVPFGLAATAQDSFGNTATSFNSSVTVAILANPGSATLGGTVTRTATAGVVAFDDLTLDHVGAGYTLSASGSGLSSATTNTLSVVAAAATQWVVTTQPPTSVTAGVGFGVVFTAEDSQGNVDPTYNGTVTVALGANPGGATLGGTRSATASAGVATFTGLTLDTAASGYTLVASGGGLTTATTSSVAIVPAAATQWVVSTEPPDSLTAGDPFGLVVTAQDTFGNVATSFNSSVTVAILANPGGATLGGTATRTATAGVASFDDLTLDHAGAGYTLSATGGGLSSATTTKLSVAAAGATRWVVTTEPASYVTAGTGFGLVLESEDSVGNVDPSYNSSVTLALGANPGGATLSGTLTATASAGVAAFTGLSLDKAADGYTLVASGGGLSSTTTSSVTIVPAAATQWVISTQPPASVMAGAAFGLAVTAQDRFGNTATSFDGSVSLSLASNPGAATLGGSVTVAAAGGLARFAGLTLSQAGQGYTLEASSGGLTPATTQSIDVTAPPVTVNSVSVQSVHTGKSKPHSVIVVQFGDALNAAAASNSGAYSLTTVAHGKKQKSKPVPLAQTSYDPVAHTVQLTTRNKLVLNPPVQLRIKTALLSGGQTGSVQAAGNGPAAGDIVATLSTQGVTFISTRSTNIPAGPAVRHR
jgi:hypothetical protein